MLLERELHHYSPFDCISIHLCSFLAHVKKCWHSRLKISCARYKIVQYAIHIMQVLSHVNSIIFNCDVLCDIVRDVN